MRRWVWALVTSVVLGYSTPAYALITFINQSSVGSATGQAVTAAASMDTTGANFLACAIADYNANSPSTITASTGGGGGQAPSAYSSTNSVTLVQVRLAYWTNPTTGNATTFTTSAGTTYVAIACIALAGVNTTSPFEAESAGATAIATTVQPGTLTPAVDNEVLITWLGGNGETSQTINESFSTPKTGGAVPGASFDAGISYKIQTTKGAQNPTWTGADTTGRAARQACFLSAAAAASGPLNLTTTGAGK